MRKIILLSKKSSFTLCMLCLSLLSFAQVGIGTTSPKAALDVVSTTQGFAMPRMTRTQMGLITGANLFDGLMVYCIDCIPTGSLNFYNNGTWSILSSLPEPCSSSNELAYLNDVSNSDLLAGLTPITTGWNSGNGASVAQLTDGIHGDTYVGAGNTVQGAWTTVGATAIYDLGTGNNGAGYDLTSIVSIADWNSVEFGNQGWTIEVEPVGGSYTILKIVDCQLLLTGAEAGASEVVLTDASGILATGIQKIRITANQVNGGANSGVFVWRELDVFGMSTLP
jgi:hypothetical protein